MKRSNSVSMISLSISCILENTKIISLSKNLPLKKTNYNSKIGKK